METSGIYKFEELENILSQLNKPCYGQVLRGKGFLKAADGYLEFSYTNGQFIINKSKIKSTGRLCLIGKDLNEKEVRNLFKVSSGGIFKLLKF